MSIELKSMTAKDLITDQEVRWCPGCGDYSILKQVQTVIPELGLKRENIVFISGIGCSSRFPYYMETYGMHSIHGRATAIASGLKSVRNDLSVWIVTGDGDSMSIGGNHFIHLMRRNFDVNILLFNNEIYGLTKGQYSPTSHEGQITKSSPYGVIDHAFNPAALCLGADATFVARAMDRDPIQLRDVLKRAHLHKGSSVLEIYQNCNVFNDGAFEIFTEKASKKLTTLFVNHGQPLLFGENNSKGIILDGISPKIVDMATISSNDLWIHDENDRVKAGILARMFDHPSTEGAMPRPFGVFYVENRPCYEDLLNHQIEEITTKRGKGNLDDILKGNSVWEIQ
ncbi:MAG TPA: 2-oxoacid:ferredoxin oxidoreductase subunit beta [Bacteroidia bacterium]|nr:2-oxoacid:ferredoxin oxidoreductase subunit beta [Bacteroidia bacterium]